MQEGADTVSQTGNRVDHNTRSRVNPVNQPLDKIFPPLERLSGSPVINRIAEENPLLTTEYSPERAEPIPETIRWKAVTAASRSAEAIFTTVVLMPFQTEDAVCFIADQI